MTNQRNLRSLLKAIAFIATIFLFLAEFGSFRYNRLPHTEPVITGTSHQEGDTGDMPVAVPAPATSAAPSRVNNITLLAQAPSYLNAILNASDSIFASRVPKVQSRPLCLPRRSIRTSQSRAASKILLCTQLAPMCSSTTTPDWLNYRSHTNFWYTKLCAFYRGGKIR